MSDIYKDGDDNLIVDFSTENRGAKMMAQNERSKRTDYDGVDLATGYPSDLIWVTSDKRRIAIPNMSNDHILNVVMYLRSRAHRYKMQVACRALMNYSGQMMMFDYEFPPEVIEEQAEAFQKKVDALRKEPTDDFLRTIFPIYSKLFAEAYKRKLTIPGWKEPQDPNNKPKGSKSEGINQHG